MITLLAFYLAISIFAWEVSNSDAYEIKFRHWDNHISDAIRTFLFIVLLVIVLFQGHLSFHALPGMGIMTLAGCWCFWIVFDILLNRKRDKDFWYMGTTQPGLWESSKIEEVMRVLFMNNGKAYLIFKVVVWAFINYIIFTW